MTERNWLRVIDTPLPSAEVKHNLADSHSGQVFGTFKTTEVSVGASVALGVCGYHRGRSVLKRFVMGDVAMMLGIAGWLLVACTGLSAAEFRAREQSVVESDEVIEDDLYIFVTKSRSTAKCRET